MGRVGDVSVAGELGPTARVAVVCPHHTGIDQQVRISGTLISQVVSAPIARTILALRDFKH
jgi:hypothetical protein